MSKNLLLAYCNTIKILCTFMHQLKKMPKFTGNAKKDPRMCLGIWIFSVWALLKKDDYNLCALCNPICLGYFFFYCSIRGALWVLIDFTRTFQTSIMFEVIWERSLMTSLVYLQGISHWNGLYELALTDRNI